MLGVARQHLDGKTNEEETRKGDEAALESNTMGCWTVAARLPDG